MAFADPTRAREYKAGWQARNRDRARAYAAKYLKANPESHRSYYERNRDIWLRPYGITSVEYDAMLARQGGVCAVCGTAQTDRRLAVDHDHVTGRVRGLLCNACNRGLGYFADDRTRLMAAAAYLGEI